MDIEHGLIYWFLDFFFFKLIDPSTSELMVLAYVLQSFYPSQAYLKDVSFHNYYSPHIQMAASVIMWADTHFSTEMTL